MEVRRRGGVKTAQEARRLLLNTLDGWHACLYTGLGKLKLSFPAPQDGEELSIAVRGEVGVAVTPRHFNCLPISLPLSFFPYLLPSCSLSLALILSFFLSLSLSVSSNSHPWPCLYQLKSPIKIWRIYSQTQMIQ